MKRYCKAWMIKEHVLLNCRMLRRLSYFSGFKAIYKDEATKPNGYMVEYWVS